MDSELYNKKRTKEEFFDWFSNWRHERSSLERSRELLLRNRDTKKMIEEVNAIYRYLRHFYREVPICVELYDGNQNFDAIIYDTSGNVIEHIEVTCAPMDKDHVIRKELYETGVISARTRVTTNYGLVDYANVVSEIISKKLSKDYPSETTLLVELASEMIVEEKSRFDAVIACLDPSISAGKFRRIVIFDEIASCVRVITSEGMHYS